jgi:hypothetical protein
MVFIGLQVFGKKSAAVKKYFEHAQLIHRQLAGVKNRIYQTLRLGL